MRIRAYPWPVQFSSKVFSGRRLFVGARPRFRPVDNNLEHHLKTILARSKDDGVVREISPRYVPDSGDPVQRVVVEELLQNGLGQPETLNLAPSKICGLGIGKELPVAHLLIISQ